MRYGLPYKGSKNAIAEWIVNALPDAECFVDLFCGGGAVTHYKAYKAYKAYAHFKAITAKSRYRPAL